MSPVLTVVIYAVVLAQTAAARQDAENRRGSYAVWEVAVYVLNALAFILIGLQLQEIVKHVDGGFRPYLMFGAAVLLTVIVVRMVWAMVYNTLVRALQGRGKTGSQTKPMRSYKSALVVGWCGMRGLLTLATALARQSETKWPSKP